MTSPTPIPITSPPMNRIIDDDVDITSTLEIDLWSTLKIDFLSISGLLALDFASPSTFAFRLDSSVYSPSTRPRRSTSCSTSASTPGVELVAVSLASLPLPSLIDHRVERSAASGSESPSPSPSPPPAHAVAPCVLYLSCRLVSPCRRLL